MKSQIFINLPVNNLSIAKTFYEAIGFTNNPIFSDDSAKCMVFNEDIFVMLMTKERFMGFATKPISDTKLNIAGIYSISLDSVERVHKLVDAGKNFGGIEVGELKDYGFMQLRSIEDPDGHTWEMFYMDISKMPQQ